MGKHYKKTDVNNPHRKLEKKYIYRRISVAVASVLLIVIIIAVGVWAGRKFASKSLEVKNDNGTKVSNSAVSNDTDKPQNSETNSDEDKQKDIIITAVGDCTIGVDAKANRSTSLPAFVQKNNNDVSYLFKNVKDIFSKDNITIANLETTFTNYSKRADKKYTFKGDPTLAKALTAGSIEGVNISNNHIYDYGQQGFNDTINTLKENNINYFGEGNKWETVTNGVHIGFLGYTGWYAGNDVLKRIKNDITDLKSRNTIVIVSFHWGDEGKYQPNSTQKYLAHYAIDNGADIVIGHHPHVMEGIEKYKDKYICYSLGNFCFGGNSNPPDKDTFIFQTKFSFEDNTLKSINVRAIPCSVSSVSSYNDYCPTPLSGDDETRVLDKLNKLNFDFKISSKFSE